MGDDCTDFLKSKGADDNIENNEGFLAKNGISGEKDPTSVAYKTSALKTAQNTEEALEALTNLVGDTRIEKGDVVKMALTKKKMLGKDGWTKECQAKLGEVMSSLG